MSKVVYLSNPNSVSRFEIPEELEPRFNEIKRRADEANRTSVLYALAILDMKREFHEYYLGEIWVKS